MLTSRQDQTYPRLTSADVDRIRRFSHQRSYRDGELLFEAGKSSPGAFVVLSGDVAVTQRDGLGRVSSIDRRSAGQFLGETAQLSGRMALVDGRAEGDVEALLIPSDRLRALLVSEADLGERLMRALILRRVNLLHGDSEVRR